MISSSQGGHVGKRWLLMSAVATSVVVSGLLFTTTARSTAGKTAAIRACVETTGSEATRFDVKIRQARRCPEGETSLQWSRLAGLKAGTRGPSGPKGTQGPAGPQGVQGPAGPQGAPSNARAGGRRQGLLGHQAKTASMASPVLRDRLVRPARTGLLARPAPPVPKVLQDRPGRRGRKVLQDRPGRRGRKGLQGRAIRW